MRKIILDVLGTVGPIGREALRHHLGKEVRAAELDRELAEMIRAGDISTIELEQVGPVRRTPCVLYAPRRPV